MELILLVGPPGAGKTTFCKNHPEYVRVSQDEKSLSHWRKLILEHTERLIIDRMNHTKKQRSKYLKFAKENGYTTAIVYLNVPYDVCYNRIIKRDNHPTIKDERTARMALGTYFKEFEVVSQDEADLILNS